MRSGGMRHRVTIQGFTSHQDPSTGALVKEWTDAGTVWADVKAISGRELIAAGVEMSEITLRIWMRYRPDVSNTSRVLWKQKGHARMAYDIVSAIPDEKASRLELLCKGGLRYDRA